MSLPLFVVTISSSNSNNALRREKLPILLSFFPFKSLSLDANKEKKSTSISAPMSREVKSQLSKSPPKPKAKCATHDNNLGMKKNTYNCH